MSAEPSRRLTHMEAIIEAIADAMRADPRVFYIGQDVGAMGGSMQGTKGLVEEFGPKRIREAPISESAMVGAALGAALFGQRPIVEVSFGEFLPAAMNQLINQAPNLHYMTGGAAHVPVVVRTRVGDGSAAAGMAADSPVGSAARRGEDGRGVAVTSLYCSSDRARDVTRRRCRSYRPGARSSAGRRAPCPAPRRP